jgi:hypothetical protein
MMNANPIVVIIDDDGPVTGSSPTDATPVPPPVEFPLGEPATLPVPPPVVPPLGLTPVPEPPPPVVGPPLL